MSSSRGQPNEDYEHKNEDASFSNNESSTSESYSSKGRDRKASKHHRDSRSDRKRKSSSKSKKRKRSSRDDHDDDASSVRSNHEEKEVRRSHHKRSRRERDDGNLSISSSTSFSSDSSDTSSDYHRKKKKSSKHRKDKDKIRKKKKKKDKKKRHRSKERLDSQEKHDDSAPYFGKYGILKASDYQRKQRSFTVWLEEVKGILSFNGPKWELQNYFKEYMEDYNTATLPHVKYYDYDKWEMEEYQKNRTTSATADKSSAHRDAALHNQALQDKAKAKRQEELDLVRNLMNKDKREEMKRKAELQAQMAHAYKTGDQETYLRLKNKLEPER